MFNRKYCSSSNFVKESKRKEVMYMKFTEKEMKILKTVGRTMRKATEQQQDQFLFFMEGMAFLLEEKEKMKQHKQSA